MATKKSWKKGRDIILFVHSAPASSVDRMRAYFEEQGRKVQFAAIVNQSTKNDFKDKLRERFDFVIEARLSSDSSIKRALKPFESKLLAITCRSESNMGSFARIIPHVPYLRTPTADSVRWAIDKTEMRRRFKAYDRTITPKYTLVPDSGADSVEKIEKKVGYPCVVKPAGLAASLLVSVCYHRDELETALRKTYRKIKKHYRDRKLEGEAKVLVEEFMEGNMYSIDSYVNSRGKVYHCPVVAVKTGQSIGIDDFFNYFRISPTKLNKKSINTLHECAEKGIHALGLRNTSTHTELMRTEDGWKIIEIGARLGGFREQFHWLSHGIEHGVNDVLIRIPEKPVIPKRALGYVAGLKFYARKEGRLKAVRGIKKICKLESIESIEQKKKVGDMCRFSKHGGKEVIDIVLFNKSRSKLLADKRRIEKMIDIVT